MKAQNLLSTRLLLIAGVLFLALFPVSKPDMYTMHVMIMALNWALLASSWDILSGYTGQLSFGHAAFYSIGAYSAVIPVIRYGVSPWIGLLLGGTIAAVMSLAIGLPSLRLRGHYLALATLGFSETVRLISLNWMEVTRGPMGLWGYSTFPGVPMPVTFLTKMCYYYIALALLLLGVFVMYMLGERSRIGLSFKAIREDETFAKIMGIDTTFHKLLGFFLSAFFAGVAGAFYAFYINLINPQLAHPINSGFVVGMAIVGGMGTIIGPVIGAILLEISYEFMRIFGVVYNLIAVGLLIMIFTLFFPRGIMGFLYGLGKRFKPSR